jgi:hypothetical protein
MFILFFTQVKIRGYRVELGEIESLLSEVPGVVTSVVAMQQGMGPILSVI